MSQQTFLIAYNSENRPFAQWIDQQLSPGGFEFKHLEGTDIVSDPTFTQLLEQTPHTILLLVSDNYLKSLGCMYRALPMIQFVQSQGKLQPIVIPGRDQDGVVETQFDRVSHVIRYMNHWQEEYLKLRKIKRQNNNAPDEELNKKLEAVRSVSTEIGEFLRLLRNTIYWEHQKFTYNHFELFFRQFSDMDTFEAYQRRMSSTSNTPPAAEPNTPSVDAEKPLSEDSTTEHSSIESIQVEEEISMHEVETISSPATEEIEVPTHSVIIEEELPIDIGSIPGMNLLQDRAPEENEALVDKLVEYKQQTEEAAAEAMEEIIETPEDLIVSAPVADNSEFIEPNFTAEESISIEEEEEEEEEVNARTKEERLKEALDYLEDEEFDYGEDAMEALLVDFPNYADARFAYGTYFCKELEDQESAITQLEAILSFDQNHQDAYLMLAEIAEKNHDYLLAKGYYEKAITINPDLRGIYYKLGLITDGFFNDQKQLAAQYFQKAFEQDPSLEDAYYRFAALHAEYLNNASKAEKYFHKTLELNPVHAFANYDLALLYHQQGQSEQALEAYKKAFNINAELRTSENDTAFGYVEKTVQEEPEAEVLSESLVAGAIASSGTAAVTANGNGNGHSVDVLTPTEEVPEPKAPKPSAEVLTVLITGATSGIGKATAEIFAQHGHRLIITGRRVDRLHQIKSEMEDTHQNDIHILPFDVRAFDSAKVAVEQLPEEWTNIDLLINNAGLAKGLSPIHEGDLEHWETMIDTNIKGLLYMTRLISPGMVKRRRGHIINVCSTAGKEVYPNGNVYCATKHAVDALTKGMRLDLTKYNIRVGQVCPAHVEETEFALVRFDGDSEKAKIYEDFKPLRSADVGEMIFFMATRPEYVNIQDVVMAGSQQASAFMIDRSGR